MMTGREVLFLDEPTRGIDVGAKVEIYNWIQNLAKRGIRNPCCFLRRAGAFGRSVIGCWCFREGHCSAEMRAEGVTQEDIMRAASL